MYVSHMSARIHVCDSSVFDTCAQRFRKVPCTLTNRTALSVSTCLKASRQIPKTLLHPDKSSFHKGLLFNMGV